MGRGGVGNGRARQGLQRALAGSGCVGWGTWSDLQVLGLWGLGLQREEAPFGAPRATLVLHPLCGASFLFTPPPPPLSISKGVCLLVFLFLPWEFSFMFFGAAPQHPDL